MTDSLDDLPQPDYEGTVDTDALETDGDNPNEMTDEQFGLLCDRMRQNGWLGGPIVTDTEGLIADGEHRWRAAQEIGLNEVPVRQFDIDDATRRLWRQELNKIHGEHDDKRDALEYDYLLDAGKSDEVHDLVDAADEDLDELLAEIKMETSKPAQYEYDPEHNVYFEDCVDGMAERLDDDSVDMVFTSPPYNVDIGSQGTRTRDESNYNDDLSDSDYRKMLSSVMSELSRVVKPSGHIFINIQNNYSGGVFTPPDFLRKLSPIPLRSLVVWDKGNYPPATQQLNYDGAFYASWEPIYHFSEEPSPLPDGQRRAVWQIDPIRGSERERAADHPAPYPKDLVERALMPSTQPGDTVLDPFMGSGTTAVAAIQNDRDYVGFELDEDNYRDVIERRISEAKRQVEAEVNADD